MYSIAVLVDSTVSQIIVLLENTEKMPNHNLPESKDVSSDDLFCPFKSPKPQDIEFCII